MKWVILRAEAFWLTLLPQKRRLRLDISPSCPECSFYGGVKKVDPISLRPFCQEGPALELAPRPAPAVVTKPRPYALPDGAPGWNRPAPHFVLPQTLLGRGRGGAGGRRECEGGAGWRRKREVFVGRGGGDAHFSSSRFCFSTTDWQAFWGSAPWFRAAERSFPIPGLETAKPPKMAYVGLTWLCFSPFHVHREGRGRVLKLRRRSKTPLERCSCGCPVHHFNPTWRTQFL